MRVFAALKLSFLTGVFFGLFGLGVTFVAPTPAYAVCDNCVVGAVGAHATTMTTLFERIFNPAPMAGGMMRQIIVGNHPVFKVMIPSSTPGVPNLPLHPMPVTSLVDYFENVWWKRMIMLEQTKTGSQSEINTLLRQMDVNEKEANNQIQHAHKVNELMARNEKGFIGAVDVLCQGPSMGQSHSAAIQAVRFLVALEGDKNAAMSAGSALYPEYSKGLVEHAVKKIKAAMAAGVIDPEGNDKLNAIIAGSSTNKDIINAHIRPDTLFGTHTLSQDPQNRHNIKLADMFVKNLFGRRMVFSPLNTINNPPTPVQSEIMDARNGVRAAVNMFHIPFDEAKSRRMPLELKSTQYNIAALERGGIKANASAARGAFDAFSKYVQDNKMSRDALDAVRYEVYTYDPQTVIQNLSWDDTNVARFNATTSLNQNALLYDILKEVRRSNELLGALGSMVSFDAHATVEAKARAANGN